MTFDDCFNPERDLNSVFLRVDGEWVPYRGNTSLRKIYYRLHEAQRTGSHKIYIHDCGGYLVDGGMFPNEFWRSLSCVSIDGVPTHALPHRIILQKKSCKWSRLGNGCGSVCTHCGKVKDDF